VELTVLGSGTAAPNPRRGAPGYLLRAGEERVLLECGAGTIDRLLGTGTDPRRLDHIVLTHHHLDHFGEIGHLLFSSRLPGYGRERPLTLAGSAALLSVFSRYSEPFGRWLRPREFPFVLHDLDDAPLEGRGVCVRGFPVDHVQGARAVRIEQDDGAVLAFSGDTDVCDGVVEAARGADLFVAEASFPEGAKKKGHLVPSEAGRLARQAGARRLLLTHFYPECDGHDLASHARKTFGGEVLLAEDGMRLRVEAAAGGRA
jgi:ribonuclease BN (tRNA processing enzyme)